jgi:hypothetical protein
MKFPYPAAQFPLALPPLLEHSLEVKQVPFRTVLLIKLKSLIFYFVYNRESRIFTKHIEIINFDSI